MAAGSSCTARTRELGGPADPKSLRGVTSVPKGNLWELEKSFVKGCAEGGRVGVGGLQWERETRFLRGGEGALAGSPPGLTTDAETRAPRTRSPAALRDA